MEYSEINTMTNQLAHGMPLSRLAARVVEVRASKLQKQQRTHDTEASLRIIKSSKTEAREKQRAQHLHSAAWPGGRNAESPAALRVPRVAVPNSRLRSWLHS